MTKSTSSSENKSDTIIKNKAKLVKAIKSIIDTNGFDYLKNKPYDVYLSLVANKSCSKKVAISVLSSLLAEVPSLLLKVEVRVFKRSHLFSKRIAVYQIQSVVN